MCSWPLFIRTYLVQSRIQFSPVQPAARVPAHITRQPCFHSVTCLLFFFLFFLNKHTPFELFFLSPALGLSQVKTLTTSTHWDCSSDGHRLPYVHTCLASTLLSSHLQSNSYNDTVLSYIQSIKSCSLLWALPPLVTSDCLFPHITGPLLLPHQMVWYCELQL